MSINVEGNKNRYTQLLKDTNRNGIEKLVAWLESTDFFTAPASSRFHLACEGGLTQHSLNVYDRLKDKSDSPFWAKMNFADDTIAICALLHDLCKISFYSVGERNVKNEETGKWEKQPFYQIDDQLPYGHGEKSVYIASGFIKLSREEAMAIRWHMGFSESKENYNSLNKAYEKFPLCLALSEADMEAASIIEPTM